MGNYFLDIHYKSYRPLILSPRQPALYVSIYQSESCQFCPLTSQPSWSSMPGSPTLLIKYSPCISKIERERGEHGNCNESYSSLISKMEKNEKMSIKLRRVIRNKDFLICHVIGNN